jgi:IclR family mhp operon transcriptional activator
MIRSLSNGLEVLVFLNRRDSASASELAEQLSIPRATVYRILETLYEKGFVYKHPDDHRYHMTPKVRILSDGYRDEDQLAIISRPFLIEITNVCKWPVALATVSGVELILRENTDNVSPLAIEHFSRGYRVPLLGSASGPCIVAHMELARQIVVLKTLSDMGSLEEQSEDSIDTILKQFQVIRSRGYSIHTRNRMRLHAGQERVSALTSISVPILEWKDTVLGAITIRYATTALSKENAIDWFVPVLTKTASEIASQRQRISDE